MYGGLRRVHDIMGLTLLVAAACSAPEPKPWWLVERVEPLALRLEVTEQGPWATQPPGARRFADPLPLDTVEVSPFIVDPDGPLPIDQLDAAWVLCGFGGGVCLDELALHGTLPECEVADPFQLGSCLLGRGPRATFTFGLPPIPIDTITSPGDLRFPQRYRMIAGVPGVEDTETCIERLRRREPMFDCIMMAGTVAFAPIERMREIMEDLGAEVSIDEAELNEREFRNRHPEVERFLVTDLERQSWATVPSGGSVDVAPGAELSIEFLEEDDDRDVAPPAEGTFDPLGAEPPSELLTLAWRFGAQVEQRRHHTTSIEMTAPLEGDVPIFVLVSDSTGPNRGMAFGWLRVRVSKSP
jgi:hypothetical protein